jgi:hypothetical protein
VAVAYAKYYPGIFLEGLRKITKTLIQDIRCPGRNGPNILHEWAEWRRTFEIYSEHLKDETSWKIKAQM